MLPWTFLVGKVAGSLITLKMCELAIKLALLQKTAMSLSGKQKTYRQGGWTRARIVKSATWCSFWPTPHRDLLQTGIWLQRGGEALFKAETTLINMRNPELSDGKCCLGGELLHPWRIAWQRPRQQFTSARLGSMGVCPEIRQTKYFRHMQAQMGKLHHVWFSLFIHKVFVNCNILILFSSGCSLFATVLLLEGLSSLLLLATKIFTHRCFRWVTGLDSCQN